MVAKHLLTQGIGFGDSSVYFIVTLGLTPGTQTRATGKLTRVASPSLIDVVTGLAPIAWWWPFSARALMTRASP